MSAAPPVPAGAHAYRPLDRLLHRIALGSRAALELSFDLERARHGRAAAALPLRPPVFVAGLARAGTTVLTQRLEAADHFASLHYADMPFPLAPNTWASLVARRRRAVARTPRGHGDGLEHDLDSAEAIEEVFWRMQCCPDYLSQESLCAHAPDAAALAAFGQFMALVCLARGQGRYLSKNNANVLRLGSLATLPGAVLVHPFRAPLEQAASLLAQHRRAIRLAGQDRFRADYMRWLGHHEFGLHRRPFRLNAGPPVSGDPDTLAYWLRTWSAVYRHVLDQPAEVAALQCFVDYDRLAQGEPGLRVALARRLGLAGALDGAGLRPPLPHALARGPVPTADRNEAEAIHARLQARAA
ncbi:sulfotransferase [Novosphingobium pokkalii]|uniref:Sulfotransferase n=1 Tax=Novosphingobium pokkalii TaxID=1770194 RepID=A0ABV7V245_9SPHN|nr:sulfotransferase [Novosphingobium pokkalii]